MNLRFWRQPNLFLLTFLIMLYLAAVWRTNESGFIVNEAGRSVALLIGPWLAPFLGRGRRQKQTPD